MSKKTAIIIGAGPAGLTAAYEFLTKTDIKPIVFEMSGDIGGIAKTVNYKGNRIDIGGHRFFSKSDRVVQWWQNIMPLADPEETDLAFLIRQRLSRIYFLRKFFDYPVAVNKNTFVNLGPIRLIKIFFSYMKVRIFPIKKENNLEDFFINRFGKELYLTFFKDYTEKVWGVSCNQIKPEWGAQRIKGLSISKALIHAVKGLFSKDSSIGQKNVETSLIGQFMYPKLGPGQMWEEIVRIILEKGGEVHKRHRVMEIDFQDNKIKKVLIRNDLTGEEVEVGGDYFISTMPVKDLIRGMGASVPRNIQNIAKGLVYRDFMTAGLLLKKLNIKNQTSIKTDRDIIPDNWIYIQEPDVKLCRLQIFNNWSPYMVKDPDTVWIGLEYMCEKGDELWIKTDAQFRRFAIEELAKIGIIKPEDVLDGTVIRMPKAYPAYFGTYEEFEKIRTYTDDFENLFLIGRNGMHRYNNQDHSMLTAMEAVDNIIQGIKTKKNIWEVNAEKDYHEKK